MATGSQLFCPFRAVGFFCNHVPLDTMVVGETSHVVTAVGNTFHLYNVDKLSLLFVGSIQPRPLQCLALQKNCVYAAHGHVIKAYQRGREKKVFRGHEGDVFALLPFGVYLVSIDDKNCLKVWHTIDEELYTELHFDPDNFSVTCAVHPATYLNKILLGSRNGRLQLWNIATGKLVYSFDGWGSPVICLAQSPAVDVVGAGLESGGVVIHNVKFDETVMKFCQDWGPVTALSFRTDGVSTVASASSVGHIAVWDLEHRRLAAVIRDAHSGSITGMKFLKCQPLLLTSAPDNSLKVWIFDQSDGSARLLRSRSGHSAPPTKVRFYTTGGLGLMSAGLDHTLRTVAINKDVSMNKELSQGSLTKKAKARGVKVHNLKLPPIIDFASEITRANEWDCAVSCHAGHDFARTWNLYHACIGKHALKSRHSGTAKARPQCVTMTACGNFAIIGMASGHVEMFNMQSGFYRGEFGRPKAHAGPVRGVAVDAINDEVFSTASDSTVKFWSFHSKSLVHTLELDFAAAAMVYHRDSSMLAVACDNFSLVVVDTDTRRIVRRYLGHRNRITDLGFSPDARWLVSCGMDCCIRTWDLPSGRQIDCFQIESPATSLAFSPTGDFLATTHVDDQGIYLWSNKTLYSHVALRPLPSHFTPSTLPLPTTGSFEEGVEEEEEGRSDEEVEEGEGEEEVDAVEVEERRDSSLPLCEGLVTLSTLPKSRWHNLTSLDVIKERNKPKEPPKPPAQAPFFLPTLPGLEPKFLPAKDNTTVPDVSESRILRLSKLQPMSVFQKCLQQCSATTDFSPLIDLLKTMSPSAIDAEFRSLAPVAGGSTEQLAHFMGFLLAQLCTRMNFELIESYLALFLKLHASSVAHTPELTDLAAQLLDSHTAAWGRIQDQLNTSACLLGYCRSATV